MNDDRGESALLPADREHVLERTRQIADDLRGARVFLTGGTGFFGKWLLESFALANRVFRLDAKITILSRDPSRFRAQAPHLAADPAIELLAGDLSQGATLPAAGFTHFLHAATETNLPSSPLKPAELFSKNVEGTRRVLEMASRCRASRFLFTSSGAVYGTQPPDLSHVPETHPGAPSTTEPTSAYGQSKRASEFLCVAHGQSAGIEIAIARCFAFVGPHLPLDANYAVGNFTRDALRGGPIRVGGDGTPFRSYLYAADLAIWLWTILARGTPGAVYNVGSNADLTIAELANVVREVVCPDAEVIVAGTPRPGVPPTRYVPCIDKAQSELGLEPWVDLREGIRRMANWSSRNA